MNISVVVPLFNEDESLPELCAWIDKVMQKNNYSYEVLLIDDGSKDKSWEVVEQIAAENTNIKGIKFRRNYGILDHYTLDIELKIHFIWFLFNYLLIHKI